MEGKHSTPSVIARLMGLDELPPQQPVKKQRQQRVLSENYLRKVASIGDWDKHFFRERRSFRYNIEENKEFKDVFEVMQSLEQDKGGDLSAENEKVHLSNSFIDAKCVPEGMTHQMPKEAHYGKSGTEFMDSKQDHSQNGAQKPGYMIAENRHNLQGICPNLLSRNVRVSNSCASDCGKTDICKNARSRTDQRNAILLRNLDKCHVNDFHGDFGLHNFRTISTSQFEPNNETCPSHAKIVILMPKARNAVNATRVSSPSGSCDCFYSSDRKHRELFNHENCNLYAQVKERNNSPNDMKPMRQWSSISGFEKGITTRMENDRSSIFLEPPRSGFRAVNSHAKEPENKMLLSPDFFVLNKSTFYCPDRTHVAREGRKGISERWRMNKEFQENGLDGGRDRSRTLGEMLALAVHESKPECLRYKHGEHGLSNKISVSDKYINLHSPLGISSTDGWKDGFVKDLTKSRPIPAYSNGIVQKVSFNWGRQNSRKPDSSEKGCLEAKNVGLSCNKAQQFSYSQLIKDKCVTDDGKVKSSLDEKGLSRSSRHNVAVGNSSGNNNQQLFESTECSLLTKDESDSSSYVVDNLSQQEDVSIGISEEVSVASNCSSTYNESLVNLEAAYQPSPVSVLEPTFEEEISSGSECFKSVNASLHGMRLQLEILKSESLEAYLDGAQMIVSSDDDDAGEESTESSEENEDPNGLFRFEESRDFSYMVDVLAEVGFCGRNQNVGLNVWHSPDRPISPSVFDGLEKKYGEQASWKRSARRLLFDRINLGLMEILQPCLGEPIWTKPVVRRLSFRQSWVVIEEELWRLLVDQEKEAAAKVLGKDDGWLALGSDIEAISIEIENSLVDELAAEVACLDNFLT